MKLFIAFVGIILFFYPYYILPTTINGRFTVFNTTSTKFSVLLQINTNSGTDDLGGATIVFSFDNNAITFPDTPVRNVDYVFHNFNGNNYSLATVTKPIENKIWVNIDLPFINSNNGTVVAGSPEWTDVVTINFDVIKEDILPGLAWNLTSLFWGIYDADNINFWETGTFEGNFALEVEVKDDWNIVSVPGINPDGQEVNKWWSRQNPMYAVYKLVGGANVTVTTTTPGEGYWMKHIEANIYNTGDEWPAGGIQRVPTEPINVLEGWNSIGGFEKVIQISQITTTPPGLIIGPIYTFTDQYQIATTLEPGRGYIVNSNGLGQINYPTGMIKEVGNDIEYFNDDWGKIIITDDSKMTYSLYLVNSDVDLNLYELPPTPPEGLFDIRFGSGRIAENIDNGTQTILMKGIDYPLKVKVEKINIFLQDETRKIINTELNSGEEITITDESINKLVVLSSELSTPNGYSLSQNYPNPFNPSTKIQFDIHYDSNVSLIIYNVLGELVTTLVDDHLIAGRYEYDFNASKLASGIYIYRIKAGDFVETKKMVLMK